MLRLIFFAFLLAVPIAEIAVFIAVGDEIGVLPTILLILGTAVLGAYLLRHQGLAALMTLQDDMRQHRAPAASIGHALCIGIAGVLLLTPGFITDTLGLLLFIPGLRRALFRQISGAIRVDEVRQPGQGPAGPSRPPSGGRTIELERGDYGPVNENTPWRDDRRG